MGTKIDRTYIDNLIDFEYVWFCDSYQSTRFKSIRISLGRNGSLAVYFNNEKRFNCEYAYELKAAVYGLVGELI